MIVNKFSEIEAVASRAKISQRANVPIKSSIRRRDPSDPRAETDSSVVVVNQFVPVCVSQSHVRIAKPGQRNLSIVGNATDGFKAIPVSFAWGLDIARFTFGCLDQHRIFRNSDRRTKTAAAAGRNRDLGDRDKLSIGIERVIDVHHRVQDVVCFVELQQRVVWVRNDFQEVVTVLQIRDIDPLPFQARAVHIGVTDTDALNRTATVPASTVRSRAGCSDFRVRMRNVNEAEADFPAGRNDIANFAAFFDRSQVELSESLEVDVAVSGMEDETSSKPVVESAIHFIDALKYFLAGPRRLAAPDF